MASKKDNPDKVKKISLLEVVILIKKGLRPAQIAKKFGIEKQNVQYYLDKGKEQGILTKIGYGTWQVDPIQEVKITTQEALSQPQKKEVRGHAFIWKVKPGKKFDWKRILNERKIKFIEVGMQGTPRIFVKNRKVWLGQRFITIYEPSSFFGTTAIDSRKYAVFELLSILKAMENQLGINLRQFKFTPRREHYALIKNNLAIQCNKQGFKINVKDDIDGFWFSIDDSFNLGEAETMGKRALPLNKKAQDYFNAHKRTEFKVTPEFILDQMHGQQKIIDGVIKTSKYHQANIKSHHRVLGKIEKAIERLANKVEALGDKS